MDQIRQYLLSIVITAIICSLFLHLLQNFQTKNIGKFICGVVLSLAILYPLAGKNIWKHRDLFDFPIPDAEEAIAEGQDLSRYALADIIKLSSEAYILDKAMELNVNIEVNVAVDASDEPIPSEVTLTGAISPQARNRLTEIIENDLGITKEDQYWVS